MGVTGNFNNIPRGNSARCETIVVIAKFKEQGFDFKTIQDRRLPKHVWTSFKSNNTLYKRFKQDGPPKPDKEVTIDFLSKMGHQNPTRYSSKQGSTSETPMCPSSLKIIKTICSINSKKVFAILSLRFKFNNSAEQFHTVKLFSINISIRFRDKRDVTSDQTKLYYTL